MRPRSGDFATAKSLIFIYYVYFMFSSGVSKLLDGGVLWASGGTLKTLLTNQQSHGFPEMRAVIQLIVGNDFLLSTFSCLALTLAISSPLFLLLRHNRTAMTGYFAAGFLFNLFVFLTTGINFLAHAMCSALCCLPIGRPFEKPNFKKNWLFSQEKSVLIFAGVCCLAIVFQRMEYPLTRSLMFASRVEPDRLNDYKLADLTTVASLRPQAPVYLRQLRPWALKFFVGSRMRVILKWPDSSRTIPIIPTFQDRLGPRGVLYSRLTYYLMEDLTSAKSPEALPSHNGFLNKFLNQYLITLLPSILSPSEIYQRPLVTLVYVENEERHVTLAHSQM